MYDKKHPETIQKMFGSIAPHYDKTNALLSFGLYKLWNHQLAKTASQHSGKHLLDLCAGTGDIAFSYAKKNLGVRKEIYLMDFCPEMLAVARFKAKKLVSSHQFHFIEADAHAIPLEKEQVDIVTCAYGVRNLRNFTACANEVWRVLKPKGIWGILELTRPHSSLLQLGHRIYLKTLLPALGKWSTKNKDAYRYLATSIQEFVVPQELETRLREIGFKKVFHRPLMGGVATLIFAEK